MTGNLKQIYSFCAHGLVGSWALPLARPARAGTSRLARLANPIAVHGGACLCPAEPCRRQPARQELTQRPDPSWTDAFARRPMPRPGLLHESVADGTDRPSANRHFFDVVPAFS